MKQRLLLPTLLVLASVGLAYGAPVVVTPADLTPDPRPGSQTPPAFTGQYAWDWDGPKPVGSFAQGGAPGFGTGAWFSDVDGSSASALPGYNGRPYTSFRLFPENIFGSAVTVSQLQDISYWSNWVGGSVDWTVRIYTKPSTGTSWFGQRANINSGNIMDGNWHPWSASTLGVSWLNNRNAGGSDSNNISFNQFLLLAGNEQIMFIDIGASYATNSPPSDTYLDGVTITLAGGQAAPRTVEVDLQPIPEPTTLSLLGLGLVALARRARKAL